jgi:hypothetical protein
MPGKTAFSRREVFSVIAAVSVGGGIAFAESPRERRTLSCDHIAWVADSLKRIQSIVPGMTRQQLLRVFTTEGGISTALQREFVSRDCPYFKVDVTFRRATGSNNNPNNWLTELDSDLIKTISVPYLQFSIMD